jgi:hypothetical protein
MSNFTLPTIDTNEIGRYGSYWSADVKVAGFWGNPISLRISRNWRDLEDRTAQWDIEVTHSSGGCERDWDKLVAEQNFADALLATLDLARSLQSRVEEIEAAYQAVRAEVQAKAEAERAERLAKIEADAPFGNSQANQVVKQMRAIVIDKSQTAGYSGHSATFTFWARGDRQPVEIVVKTARTGITAESIFSVQMFNDGRQISAREVTALIASEYSLEAGFQIS